MGIFRKINNGNTLKIKIFGFTVYKKITDYCSYQEVWFKFILKKYKQYGYNKFYTLKKIYLFNILISKSKILDLDLMIKFNTKKVLEGVRRLNTINALHQKTFSKYKNINKDKTVILVGAGPTVNYFETIPENNIIYIGCNRAFLIDKIKFDFLFTIDKVGIQQYYKEFLEYKGNNCIKFFGDQNLGIDFQIPESYINQFNNIERYKTTANLLSNRYTFDIDAEPLGNFNSVAMQAMQFILYTNPKKVYLVGIDCNTATAGYFTGKGTDTTYRGEIQTENDINSLEYWQLCKNFKDIYYPETEIISINPVGLRGVFKDMYTQSYMEANPEIKNILESDIKIIEENYANQR